MTTSGICERKLPPSRSFWPALTPAFTFFVGSGRNASSSIAACLVDKPQELAICRVGM